MSKAGGTEGEETEGLHKREDAGIAEAEARRALGVDDDGLGEGVEVIVADQAVVAQIFDAQEAPVGGKADLPQGGQIAERTTDLEVIRVVDGGFGPKGLPFFVVLLDLGLLVLHMERRHDTFGQHARPKAAGCAARDASIKDQLHLIRPTDVEILANHFFEETAARERPIEDLGQRELGLQDGEVISIAGGAVGRGEGRWETAQPFADDGLDLRGIELMRDRLHAGGILGGADAIVQRFIGDAAPRQLPFQPLVPVETDLRRVRKVGAELDKERAEVAVENVDVVMIGHGGRPDDPRVLLPFCIPSLLGAEDTRLFLRLADEEDAFSFLNAAKDVCATSSSRCPFLNVTRSTPSVWTKRSIASTNR